MNSEDLFYDDDWDEDYWYDMDYYGYDYYDRGFPGDRFDEEELLEDEDYFRRYFTGQRLFWWTTVILADHPFVKHPTYTGPGCAICGTRIPEKNHPTKKEKNDPQR